MAWILDNNVLGLFLPINIIIHMEYTQDKTFFKKMSNNFAHAVEDTELKWWNLHFVGRLSLLSSENHFRLLRNHQCFLVGPEVKQHN